jgi:hypothetical protein
VNRVPPHLYRLTPDPHQHFLLFVFVMTAILTGVRWNPNVILIYSSLIAKDAEHFFMSLLPMWFSSFEK